MKLIRSIPQVTISDRTETRTGIVAIYISEWKWQDKFNRYVAEVIDYEVTDRQNPQPGEPLKNYVPISQETKYRTKAQIDGMFGYLATDIVHTESYTEQYQNIIVQGLLLETQQLPIRDSKPEDWEIVDTDDEIMPIPE